MIDLRSLYQDVILDHSRNPRNSGALEPHSHEANGNNPLCGDKVRVYMQVGNGKIDDIRFEAKGCAISMASASMMTELIKGSEIEEARATFARFHETVTRKGDISDEELEALDKLATLIGVREFPMRIKCATLPWHTMTAALDGVDDEVTTE